MTPKAEKIKTVTAGGLLTAASTGVFANGSAVFMPAVCAELGFPRGEFALINSVSLIFSMASLLIFGRILNFANIKLVVGCCAAVCALVPLGYSFCGEIWQFYLLAALNGIFVNGITLLTVAALLERMELKAKGVLLGTSFGTAGAVSFVMLPIIQKTVQQYGWRWGYRLQSAVGAVLLLAAVAIIKNARPIADQSGKKLSLGLRKFVSNRSFVFAAAGLFFANAGNVALFNHTAANLSDLGFAPSTAASVLSFAVLFTAVSKPLFGLLLDKLGLKTGAITLGFSIMSAASAALMLNKSTAAFYLYPLLLSACSCANSIPANAFASQLFDREEFTAAASLFTFAATAGSAAGAPLAGAVFDKLGSYTAVWWGCIAAGTVTALLLTMAVNNQKQK